MDLSNWAAARVSLTTTTSTASSTTPRRRSLTLWLRWSSMVSSRLAVVHVRRGRHVVRGLRGAIGSWDKDQLAKPDGPPAGSGGFHSDLHGHGHGRTLRCGVVRTERSAVPRTRPVAAVRIAATQK